MVDRDHRIREPWRQAGAIVDQLGPDGLAERAESLRRLLEDDGVTYRLHGSDTEQPWMLDPLPLILDEAQWITLEESLVQRAELLDAILSDLYGERRLLRDAVLPPHVIYGHSGFLREVDQIRMQSRRQLFLTACDLARNADGELRILSEHAQAPSGAGYAMENRRALARAMTGMHRASNLHRIGPFFQTMRQSLQRLSPGQHEAPRVVLLTSGTASETGFDQAYLSALLGFPLVEGADLVVRDARVWQRSVTGRLEPVDVILRRVDSWFCDPLELRPDSQLGIPGLVEATRRGNVAVANPLGSGVLENPALHVFMPQICRYLLDEDLRLAAATTWWCGDPASLQHALSRMDSLAFKPITREVRVTSRLGWTLNQSQRDSLAARIASEPHAWVAQERLALSSAPTVVGTGLQARPVVLRTFAVSDGASYRVMPGGLVRAAPTAEAAVVSNSAGAISKDLWVLASERQPQRAETLDILAPDAVSSTISPRVAEDMFWLGRYAERAEATTRLLRVTYDRWRDTHAGTDPSINGALDVLLHTLTSITSLTGTWPTFTDGDATSLTMQTGGGELLALLGDDRRLGTVAHDVRRLRELANAVRDQLCSDTWLALSSLDRALAPFSTEQRQTEEPTDITSALAAVVSALLAFSGLVTENMVRDAGWYYLDLGRRVERALQIADLLRTCLSQEHPLDVELLVLESTLLTADSLITHRRRFSATSGAETVLELLLSGRDNPRSVAYQLERIIADLSGLGQDTEALLSKVRSIVATLHNADTLQMSAVTQGRRAKLDEILSGVSAELADFAMAINDAHFVPAQTLIPLDPFSVIPSPGPDVYV